MEQGLEGAPYEVGGLGKSHQAAVQCPSDHSPHPVLQDPSSSQSTRTQTLQVRMQQHKRQQMY